MASAERKPPVPMESREPHSIRFTPTEWAEIATEAQARGLEPAVFVRKLALIALDDLTRYVRAEAAVGVPGIPSRMLTDSRRTRRF